MKFLMKLSELMFENKFMDYNQLEFFGILFTSAATMLVSGGLGYLFTAGIGCYYIFWIGIWFFLVTAFFTGWFLIFDSIKHI